MLRSSVALTIIRFFQSFKTFKTDLLETPVPHSFAVNSASLGFSVCLLFPVAGWLSDKVGRKLVMGFGGIFIGTLSPVMIVLIGRGNAMIAFLAQSFLGICLSLWGAPMMAWLAESFEPAARLTSVSIGYNVAQALGGGMVRFDLCDDFNIFDFGYVSKSIIPQSPAIATELVDKLGLVSCCTLISFVFCSSPNVPIPSH